MKKSLLICFILSLSFSSKAIKVTAVKSGAWETVSTWDISNWGVGKDTIVIPYGTTVTVNSNIELGLLTIVLQDNGVLSFVGGGSKLNLNAASTVIVGYSGLITASGSPSQVLKIGGNTVFTGNEDNVSGLSYATSTTSGFIPSTILPVRFTDISIARQNSRILVQWSTAQETDSYSFEIERSLDGINWTKAGTVAASGNSTSARTYSFSDQNNTNQVYYRIKQVDPNGMFTYSTVKSICAVAGSSNAVNISSTGDGKVILQFARTTSSTYTVRVVSLNGQVVSQQQISGPSGNVVLPLSYKGAYVVSVIDGKNVHAAKQVLL